MPDYLALRAALADFPGKSDAEIAAELNARTVTKQGQPFVWSAAQNVALASPNFSWARIVQRARQTAQLPPITDTDAAILAAQTAVAMSRDAVVTATGMATLQAGFTALLRVGDLIPADVAAIQALSTITVSAWDTPITVRDIWIARGQPEDEA